MRALDSKDASGSSAGRLPSNLSALAKVMEESYGFRTDAPALRRLHSVVAERTRALDSTSVDEYLALLHEKPEEMDYLIEDFVVGETAFFRTPVHFEHLRRTILPALDQSLPSDVALRLWSAGCASGEEAYSLAIVCAEVLNGRRDFNVLGADLSTRAIAAARRARYRPRALAKVTPELNSRYFEPCGAEQQVIPSIRERVHFEQMNLLSIRPRHHVTQGTHVILCENVLIYLTPSAITRLLAMMATALAPGGYLFLGYSEQFPADEPGMEIVWLNGTPVWRKYAEAVAAPVKRPRHEPPDRKVDALSDVRQPADLETETQEHLKAATAHADAGQRDTALLRVRQALALSPLSAEAHALLATIHASAGECDEAIRAFERALYLSPNAPLVRFQFASALRGCGHTARARREFASLAKSLERLPPDDPIGELSVGLLLSACRTQLGN